MAVQFVRFKGSEEDGEGVFQGREQGKAKLKCALRKASVGGLIGTSQVHENSQKKQYWIFFEKRVE